MCYILSSGVDSQQLQCSALDAAKNLYYFPSLRGPLEGSDEIVAGFASSNTYILSSPGVSFIYSVPSTQVNCSGTVLVVEYCYRGSNGQLGTELLAFTLLTLEQNGRDFRVTDRIEIRTTPLPQICTGDRFILPNYQYCCGTTSLNMADHFILPASNFAFGIAIPTTSSVSLLGHQSLFQVAHYQESQTIIPSVGSTFSVGNQVTQGLKLLRFQLSELE